MLTCIRRCKVHFFRNNLIMFGFFKKRKLPPEAKAESAKSTLPEKKHAEAMREMRLMWLARIPAKEKCKNEDEVVAVLMDWPVGGQIATILSSLDGDASLYTTSTFGIIGGVGHEKVRKAAMDFVACAQHFIHITTLTKEYPYPDEQTVLFYMITSAGVRTVSFPMKDIEVADSPAQVLFAYGQQVLTELRLIASPE